MKTIMSRMAGNVWRAVLVISTIGIAAAMPYRAEAGNNDWAPLSAQDQATTGFNWVGVFDATNFPAVRSALFPRPNGTTVNFPAGTKVNSVLVKLVTAFQTGTTGAVSAALSIGDFPITNRYVNVMSVGTNAGSGVLETNGLTGVIGYNVSAANRWSPWGTNHFNHVYTSATNLLLSITTDGDSPAVLTSGRFEVYLRAIPLNDIRGGL